MFSVTRRVLAAAASTFVVMGLTAGAASAVTYDKGEAGNAATAYPGKIATLSSTGTLTETASYKCGPLQVGYFYLGIDVTQGNGGYSAPHASDATIYGTVPGEPVPTCDGTFHTFTFTMASSGFTAGKAYAVTTLKVCGTYPDGTNSCTPFITRRSGIQIVGS